MKYRELLLRFMVGDDMLGNEFHRLERIGYIEVREGYDDLIHWNDINHFKITEKGLKKIGKV